MRSVSCAGGLATAAKRREEGTLDKVMARTREASTLYPPPSFCLHLKKFLPVGFRFCQANVAMLPEHERSHW